MWFQSEGQTIIDKVFFFIYFYINTKTISKTHVYIFANIYIYINM